jgi:hypothetical protein
MLKPRIESEQWFERYLDDHGAGWKYERDLGVATRRDYDEY